LLAADHRDRETENHALREAGPDVGRDEDAPQLFEILVTVNAEEPPAFVPIDADKTAAPGVGSGIPRTPVSAEGERRVERIDALGDVS